ncbi:hypothetical protein D3C73_871320 [compost metagenome]
MRTQLFGLCFELLSLCKELLGLSLQLFLLQLGFTQQLFDPGHIGQGINQDAHVLAGTFNQLALFGRKFIHRRQFHYRDNVILIEDRHQNQHGGRGIT